MGVNKLADDARNGISDFCIEECKAYCCRKGYLVLTIEELELVTKGNVKGLMAKGIVKKHGDKYSLHLGASGFQCPSLDGEFKCTIHKDPKRPSACKQFPVFIWGKMIRVSERCLALKAGKLYPYIKEFERNGYGIVDDIPFSDIEFGGSEL